MYPFATDLASRDPLPDTDDVARYCKPSSYDNGILTFLAFMDDYDISVNRLQFFQRCSRQESVQRIIQEVKGYLTVKTSGDFVVFNVAQAKEAARSVNVAINILYTPRNGAFDSSHSSIIVADDDMLVVATELVKLITSNDHYSIS